MVSSGESISKLSQTHSASHGVTAQRWRGSSVLDQILQGIADFSLYVLQPLHSPISDSASIASLFTSLSSIIAITLCQNSTHLLLASHFSGSIPISTGKESQDAACPLLGISYKLTAVPVPHNLAVFNIHTQSSCLQHPHTSTPYTLALTPPRLP